MKKIYGLAAFAAMLSLASCSNNDEPVVTPGAGEEVQGTPAYIAVNIMKDDGTRANDAFAYGEDYENTVTNATFVLFNSSNQKLQVVTLAPTSWDPINNDPNVDDTSVAATSAKVLVINRALAANQDDPVVAEDKMVTILNAPPTLVTALEASTCNTLSKVRDIIEDYTGDEYASADADGKFVMSTSVYNDGTNNIYWTSLKDKDGNSLVKKSVDEALASAVDVYVDRVVSKVSIVGTLENKGAKVDFFGKPAATDPNVDIVIKKMTLANLTDKAPVIKNIEGVSETWSWNDKDNFRSYWANTPMTSTAGDGKVDFKHNLSWTNYGTSTEAIPVYINENTNQSRKTCLLVTAELQKDGKALDLVLTLEGKRYYEATDGKTAIVNTFTSKYCYKDGNTYKSLTPDMFDWKAAENSADGTTYGPEYAQLYLKTNVELYIASNGNWKKIETGSADETTFKNELKSKACTVLKWTNGAAYYFIPIRDARATKDGVVRNHLYTITLKDIQGLGVPVFNPSDEIIPEVPTPLFDEKTYFSLGATINVNKWANVSQDAHFGHDF